jgi:hypothetical protein
MQHNPYGAPDKPITSDKGGVKEPDPLQILVSAVEVIIGVAGIVLYFIALFKSGFLGLIGGLPLLAVALLILWSGVMLWRNNRYAWLPISIIAVPFNLMMDYMCAWQFQLVPRYHDPLKEEVQNPHTLENKIAIGLTAFSLLLLACSIYSFAIRNSMPQTDSSSTSSDTTI